MTTLAFLGDLMLGRGVNRELRHVPPESVWGSALPLLRGVDGVIANLECAITLRDAPTTLVPKVSHFRADPAVATVLRAGNVRCVSLANDHSLDFGEEGLFDTLDVLEEAGIAHTGAGRTLGQAAAPAIVRLPGVTAAIVGLTGSEPAFAATARAAGTHYVDISSGPPPGIGLAQLASHCRERKADLAILSLHWPPSLVTPPPPLFREFAHAAIDAGFDLVHGHSSHLVKGVEIHRGKPILYDTGDFIDDYRAEERLRSEWSFVFLADIGATRIERIRLYPVRLGYARVDVAAPADSQEIRKTMKAACAALGTEVGEGAGTLDIDCSLVRETAVPA
jgi:poly-gamma-glutamate capsule biosynthesis protein CapA/YwtB (metallophosphatase superfamily)